MKSWEQTKFEATSIDRRGRSGSASSSEATELLDTPETIAVDMQITMVDVESDEATPSLASTNSISEKLPAAPASRQANANANVPASTVALWLGMWFVLNIGVTFWNKKALTAVRLPVTLTFVHMVCNSLGAFCYVYIFKGIQRKSLNPSQRNVMISFSLIFVSNIVTGNWSLGLVSITFNQIMRALVPGVVVVLSTFILSKTYSRERKLALIPVAYGVYLTCTGDNSATFLGFCITLLAVVLAALKGVLSSKFLTGDLKLHPVDLILHQAPLSALWCFIAMMVTGETTILMDHWSELPSLSVWYIITGLISFLLNITSFQANKVTSPVTLSVCANVKQIVVVALSLYLAGDALTTQKILGITLVTVGGIVYAYISNTENHKASMPSLPSRQLKHAE